MSSYHYHNDKQLPPPYGPTRGMLQGLQMLQKMSPAKVDTFLLQEQKIAPGNEYKVIGALRFLELIDADGIPTEISQLLKTRGATFTLALQDIIRSAYADLFSKISLESATWEQIYNYFVTETGVGTEMAAKATRFFIGLCQLAELGLAPDLSSRTRRLVSKGSVKKETTRRRIYRRRDVSPKITLPQDVLTTSSPLPLIFAITPEAAQIDEEQFVKLFRKMRRAFRRALAEE